MHKHVIDAVTRLQARLDRSRSHWAAEQTEEALNLLLKRPDNSAPALSQMRDGMREASRKLSNRGRLLSARFPGGGAREPSCESDLAIHALRDFVTRDVIPRDRPLLSTMLEEGSVEDIAEKLGIPVDRARERLSRARSRAWPLWLN